MRQLSFRQRQFLILLVLAIAPLALVAVMGLSNTRASIIQRTTAQLETVADLKTAQVQQWLDQGHEAAYLVANLRGVQEELPVLLAAPDAEARALAQADLYAELGAITDIHFDVRSVSLLHPTSGQVLLSTDPTQEGRERWNEDYFRSGQQALYVSPVVYSVSRETPVLTVSAPVRDKSGELLSVVAVEMNLADLGATLSSRAGLGQTGRAYLVETYGFYVTLPPDLESSPLRVIAKSEGVDRTLDGQNGSDTYLDPRGVPVLGVYRWLPEVNLGLLVEIEEAELTSQIRRAGALIVLMNLGVLVLGVVAARYLTNWLVTPLERIAGAARALQSGDLSHRAPPGGPDEIGQLATAFNEMAASLQGYYENLEQLVEQRTAALQAANEELAQEITERKRAEEALRESEERYRSLFEGAKDHIFIIDQDLRYVTVNPSALKAGDFTLEDIVGKGPHELFPGDAEFYLSEYRQVFETREPVWFERELKLPDGSHWFSVTLSPIKDAQGRVLALTGISRDITERKRAEEALRESEERMRLALEGTDEGLWDWDLVSGAVTYDDNWVRILGYMPGEMEFDFAWWERSIHPDSEPVFEKALNAYLEGREKFYELEYQIKDKSGEWRWIWARGICVAYGEQSEPLRMIGTHRDITDRRRAEEQIRASLREKTVLLQEIHHRVKNNLAIVSSLLEWQSEMIEDERARAAFQDSQNRVHSMARIHESLYRSQELARVDMVEYIEELVDYLRQAYGTYAIPLKIEAADVALDIDTALPCGLIINELVANAMKHAFPAGQSGDIHIALRSDDDQVELTVGDNGVGLPADVDLEDPKSLGLTLVNLLAQQLGGTLEVDRGEGTTLKLTFAVTEERDQDNDG